jgi:uncharacterized protein (TIRG00374 family)
MRKRWWNFISILAIMALLYFVLRRISVYEIYILLKIAKKEYFLLAVLSIFLTFIVWTIRWTHFFGEAFRKDFLFLLKVLFAGAFFNTITPGAGIGGEPFRAHFLAKRYKKSRAMMLAYVLGDKFFQLMTLAIFAIFSIFFVFIYIKISNTLTYILEGVLTVVLILISFTIYSILRKTHFRIGVLLKKLHFFNFFKKRFETPEELESYADCRIKSFSRIFKKMVKSKKNLIIGFSLAIVFWLLTYLSSYFIFLAFNYPVNFLSVVVVVTLGTLIGDLSLIPSGIGIIEVSMTLLYSAMGILLPVALLVALLARIIYYFFSLVVGGLCLINVRRITNSGKISFF